MLLAVVVVAAFFLLIWSRIALDHNAFVLQELESQTAVEESLYWDLRVEAARLQAPERIIAAATEMGMAYPDSVHTVEVPGMGSERSLTEDRWIDLKQVLGARP
jgi:cell division protein FtsL